VVEKGDEMSPRVNGFSKTVYHRQGSYDLAPTIFSRRELKVLIMVNGRRSVSHIAKITGTDPATLKPVFARLVQLGLIQTEDTLVPKDETDLFLDKEEEPPTGSLYQDQP